MKIRFCAIILLFFIVGCQTQTTAEEVALERIAVVAESEEVVEATAVPTDTPIPPTETAVPATHTPVPTETATPTDVPPTETVEPTDTPEPSPTATNTAVPTKAATAVPPTPTPQPRSDVHSFSSTEVVPFTDELFLYHIGRLRDTMVEMNTIYIEIGYGKSGSCIGFGSPHKNWTTHLPIYPEVPDKYYPLYAEYRSIIHQAVMATQEIANVCADRGGEVSDETDAQVRQLLSWAVPRTEAMVQESIVLSQQ